MLGQCARRRTSVMRVQNQSSASFHRDFRLPARKVVRNGPACRQRVEKLVLHGIAPHDLRAREQGDRHLSGADPSGHLSSWNPAQHEEVPVEHSQLRGESAHCFKLATLTQSNDTDPRIDVEQM